MNSLRQNVFVIEGVSISTAENLAARVIARLMLAFILYPLVVKVVNLDIGSYSTTLLLHFAGTLIVTETLFQIQRRLVSNDFRIVAKRAVLPLLTPVIILGGILGGVATPTEASALAVAYTALLGLIILRSIN